MTLIQATRDLPQLDQEATLYVAEPWTPESTTIVEREPSPGGLPAEVENLGLKYFLEVFVARDFVEGWARTSSGPRSDYERCARLIQYAVNDA